jgi:hypothetical protein
MADDFGLAIQVGIRAALAANAGVTSIVSTRIYDEPPQGVVFPYLRFGQIIPVAFDTDSKEGSLVNFGIEAQSRSIAGRVEAMQMVEAVKSALHRKEALVTVSGFNLVELIFLTYSAERNNDGRGYVATISLQALLESIA